MAGRPLVGVLAAMVAATLAVTASALDVPFTYKDLESEESLWSLYERWRAVYTSSSLDLDDINIESRFEAFKANARYVNEFNKKEDMTYKLGLNKFADMIFEEFVTKYGGAKLDIDADDDGLASGQLEMAGNDVLVPDEWDWRKYGFVAPVKQELPCGGSWAPSVVDVVNSINAIVTGDGLLTLSEQQVIDCSGDGDCNGEPHKALEYAVQNGMALDQCGTPPYYPAYNGKKNPCRTVAGKPSFVKVDSVASVPYANESALKIGVYRQPVLVAIDASRGLMMYKEGVFNGPCKTTPLNHVMVVVGYGVTHDNKQVKYWIVKNYWGTLWGEGGYIRMERDIADKRGICGIATKAMYPTKKGMPLHAA